MHVPEFRDKRLADETIRRLDAFAAAEETGTESAALAETLIDELSSLSPFDITAFERAVRDAYRYAPHRVRQPTPSLVERLTSLFDAPKVPFHMPPSLSGRWLRLLHPNGYIRENVLKAIDAPPPASIFLAALLLSLNDHVPEVRTAARQCLERLNSVISDDVIIAAVPYIVVRSPIWRNGDDHQAIDRLLRRGGVRAAIRSLLLTRNDGWLPRFFRDLLASDIVDPWLEEVATSAMHPAVRGRSLHVLMDGKVDHIVRFGRDWWSPVQIVERRLTLVPDIGALIVAGARDRATVVRKATAQGMVRHYRNLPDPLRLLDAFGEEKNAAVRERLDFIRRQLVAG